MKRRMLISIGTVLVFLGQTSGGAQASIEKRVEALEALVKNQRQNDEADAIAAAAKYPVDDQHDTLSVNLQEAITDANVNKIEKDAREVQWDTIQDAYSHGAIPEATMLALRLQMKIDGLNEQALQYKSQALRAKISSLEGLQGRNTLQFYQGDADTNEAQLQWWELEQQKAQATADYSADVYSRLHQLYLMGSGTWASDHQAEVEAKTSTEAVEGWKRKIVEQIRQRDTSAQALQDYKKHHPQRVAK